MFFLNKKKTQKVSKIKKFWQTLEPLKVIEKSPWTSFEFVFLFCFQKREKKEEK